MKYFLIFFVLVLLLTNFSRAQSDFETNSLLIKASVKQSGLETKTITISSKTSGEFFLKIESLKGVNVEEERFSLNGGEEKVVEINFDSRDIEPGIYIPDWGGVRLEDVVVVKDDGYEVLTKSPKSIREVIV